MALDQPVIVENRTGAQGRLGVQAVKAAAPDGKTLLLTPVAPMSVYAHVYKALLYDPVADFEPVSQVATFDFAIAVGPQVPAKSLKELVAWVKANPAQGNYGTPAAGTLPHFFAVSFAKTAGLDLRHVGYRGSAAALTDLVGGQISDRRHHHQRRAGAAQGRPHQRARHLRQAALAVPAGLPTFKQAGYDIEGSGWYGVYAPAKTPPDVVAQLNKAIVAAVRPAPVQEKLLAFGLVPAGTTATELRKIQAADPSSGRPPCGPRVSRRSNEAVRPLTGTTTGYSRAKGITSACQATTKCIALPIGCVLVKGGAALTPVSAIESGTDEGRLCRQGRRSANSGYARLR